MDVWLASERLDLRRPNVDDAEAVFRVHSDERTYAHLPSGRMRVRDEADGLVQAWSAHWDTHGFGYAVVQRRSDADVIGFCGVKHQHVTGEDVLNLYYRFAPEAWGGGYATEAATAVTQWASRSGLGLPVVARIALNNPASASVARRVGFVLTQARDPEDPVPHELWRFEPEPV